MSSDERQIHSLEGTDPRYNKLKYISDAITHYVTNVTTVSVEQAKRDTQLEYALGMNLDEVGAWFSLSRVAEESDESFRRRILAIAEAPINPTVDAIQDVYEALIGLRPVITEDFITRVLSSGESVPTDEVLAAFTIQFNVEISTALEMIIVEPDGISLTLGHTTNIDSTPTKSDGTNGVTIADPDDNFTSAGATFDTDRILPSNKLVIEDGLAAGTYTITGVVNNTTLTIYPEPVADTGATYHIPTFYAYDHENDSIHLTNLATSINEETGIMTLSGGPYPLGTLFDVEYEIVTLGAYDTLEELTDNLPVMESILELVKPAGVKTGEIQFVKFLASWFQSADIERLEAIDFFLNSQVLTPEGLPEMAEELTDSLTPLWGYALWCRHHWGQEGPIIDAFSFTLT